MTSKLPDKVGGKVKGRGKVVRIRTKKLPGGKVAHVRIMSKKGKRGGQTLMGEPFTPKKRTKKKHG